MDLKSELKLIVQQHIIEDGLNIEDSFEETKEFVDSIFDEIRSEIEEKLKESLASKRNIREQRKKGVSIATIIERNKDSLYQLISELDYEGATDLLEDLLTDALKKGEIDSNNAVNVDKCISSLRKLINRPNVWMTTFGTWQLGGDYRVGYRSRY